MKRRSSWCSRLVAVGACVLCGCGSAPQHGEDGNATAVRVYGSGQQPAVSQYEVVRHIWVDSGRSAFSVPSYPSQAVGIAALQVEAAGVGADGLINVICLDQGHPKWSWSTEPAVLCYGNAIRLRRSEG